MNDDYYYILITLITLIFVVGVSLSKNPTLVLIMMPIICFTYSALIFIRKNAQNRNLHDVDIKYYRGLHPSETASFGKENDSNHIYSSKVHHEVNSTLSGIKEPTPGHVTTAPVNNDPSVVDHSKTSFNESVSINDDYLSFNVFDIVRTDTSLTFKYNLGFKGVVNKIRFASYSGDSYNNEINISDSSYLERKVFNKTLGVQDVFNNYYQFRLLAIGNDVSGVDSYIRTYDFVMPLTSPIKDETLIRNYTNATMISHPNFFYSNLRNNNTACSVVSSDSNITDEFEAETYCLDTLTNCIGFIWVKETSDATYFYSCKVGERISLDELPVSIDGNVTFMVNQTYQNIVDTYPLQVS